MDNTELLNQNNTDKDTKENKSVTFKSRLVHSLIVMLFPVLTFFILSPLEIYAGNQSELMFGIKDFIWVFAGIALGILVVCTLVLALIPQKISSYCELLVFAGTFMAYIQNMFLNKTLMKTDGSKIDWGQYVGYSKFNAIVWFAVIVIIMLMPLWLKKYWQKAVVYVSGCITAIEAFAVFSLLFTLPYKANASVTLDGKEYAAVALSGEGELELAPEKNIIVIVLDRYANIIFENGPHADPNFYDTYADFTYYNNANSSYNFTFPSMVYMMTGVEPDCTITTKEYKTSAWDKGVSKAFHDKLNAAGYTYNFYTQSGGHVYYDAAYLEGSIDNIEGVDESQINVHTDDIVRVFTKMTGLKYGPYVIKPYLEVQSIAFNGMVSYDGVPLCYEGNSGYFEALKEQGLRINDNMENAVILQQLSGIHTPYTMRADGSECGEDEYGLDECQLGINVMLDEYMNQLKELGIYDDATIIITADHGLNFDMRCPQPIYLIKRAGETHDEMQWNSAPISTEDYMATILEEAGLDYSGYGTSISDWSETDERERSCAYPNNGFDVYTYTGSCNDLVHKMDDNECTRIEATEDWD